MLKTDFTLPMPDKKPRKSDYHPTIYHESEYRNKDFAYKSYVVCVEPETQKTFMVNMGKEEVTEIIIQNNKMVEGITNKVRREEYKIDSLLERKEK